MAHGAHEAVELHEHIEHASHGGHHHRDHESPSPVPSNSFNKRVALLISILAALLAGAELGGKSAQNEYTAKNIAASDMWNFYQAKQMRETVLRAGVEQLETIVSLPAMPAPAVDAARKVTANWRAAAERYASDPASGEGRKELMAKARALESSRDHALAAYHNFEYASAACQLAIVLASAAVVTGIPPIAVLAGGLGAVGVGFAIIGWQFPDLFHGGGKAQH